MSQYSPTHQSRSPKSESVRPRSTISHRHVNRTKDELEYATNWRRVFIEIY